MTTETVSIRHRRVPVLRRLAVHRWRQLAALALMAFAFSTLAVGVAALQQSARAAQESGVRSSQAGYRYAVQDGDGADVTALSRSPGTVFLRNSPGFVLRHEFRTPATVKTVRVPGVELGVLLQGRWPSRHGDLAVSRAVVESLDAGLGDEVQVAEGGQPPTSARVVGITVNPSDVGAVDVVRYDAALEVAAGTIWLSNTDPYSLPELSDSFDKRVLTYRSIDSLVAEVSSRLPVGLSSTRYVPACLIAIFMVVVISLSLVFIPVAVLDVATLTAAGMAPRRAWGLVQVLACSALLVGQIAGATTAACVLQLARGRVSLSLGQYWTAIRIPWSLILWLIALTLVMCAAGRSAAVVARSVQARLSGRGDPSRSLFHLSMLMTVAGLSLLVAAVLAKRRSPPEQTAELAPMAALVVATALPVVLSGIPLQRMPMGTRALLRRFTSSFRVVVVVATVVALVTAGYSAKTTRDANAIEAGSRPPQPVGSLLITEIPDQAAESVIQGYRREGGRDVVQYALPDERELNFRVTGPKLLGCLRDVPVGSDPHSMPDKCFPQHTYSPINQIAIALDGVSLSRADPGLIDGGEVGLLLFVTGTGSTSELALTKASPDPRLGGNMPGLVVARDSPVARRFSLRPAGTRTVALLDFARLSQQAQARMRGAVARLAPAAQTADATAGDEFDQLRSLAKGAALGGAAVVVFLLWLGGGAVLAGNRRTLRCLIDVGASRRARTALAVRWAALPLAVFVLLLPLTLVSALTASVNESGRLGWIWVAPIVAGLTASGVLVLAFLRVPDRLAD